MKFLKPLPLLEKYYAGIEKEINAILLDALYRRIIRALDVSGIYQNSNNALLDALSNGRIEYNAGKFAGKFSVPISRGLYAIGARYNGRTKTWDFKGVLPVDVQMAVYEAERRYKALADSLIRTLDVIDVDKAVNESGLERNYFDTINKMDSAFVKSVQSITVPPQLSFSAKRDIARTWTNNLKLYVKNFTSQQIVALRSQVQKNAYAGQRAENLVKTIQDSYEVSKHKAKFLARQETSLLMSKMRETRYKDIGINRYRWSTSGDERVRKIHAQLNGKIYSWDSPPIVDDKGNRANPGETYNCRCVAVPVLPGDE